MSTLKPAPTNRELVWWGIWIFWKTPGYRWLLLMFAGLVGIACLCGYQSYQRRLSTIETLESYSQKNRKLQRAAVQGEEAFEQVLGGPLTPEEERNAKLQRVIATLPTSLAYSGGNFLATLPPSPMMILSVGVSDLWPDRFSVTARSQRENLQREEVANPYQLEAGTWDVTTIVVYILPLVILTLTYNFVSSDREEGTLRVILSNPIGCRRWTILNLFVRTLIPIAVVLPAAIVPIVVAIGSEHFQHVLVSAGLWAFATVVYGLFWMSASLLVNSFGGSSQQNGIMLAILWVVYTGVIPHAATRFAQYRQPVMSQRELITKERAFRQSAESNAELKDKYYREHPEVSRPTKKEDPYNQTRWDVIRLKVDTQMRPLIRSALAQMQSRFELCQLGGLISPAFACQLAHDDLCGTSLAHHVEFVARASEFDEEFKEFFQPRMMSREELTSSDHNGIPTFQHRKIAWRHDQRLLAAALITILVWSTLFITIGYRQLQTHALVSENRS